MRLSELVTVSARLQATPGRHGKIAQLAEWLRRLPPAELAIGAHYMSGSVRQGRIAPVPRC